MKYDLDHFAYQNYLAEKHYKDKESTYLIREMTLTESSSIVALQEANLNDYLHKIVANVQKVWNTFKTSVVDLYQDVKFENLKGMKATDNTVELKQGDKIPNLSNIDTFIKLQPMQYQENPNETNTTVNDLLKQAYSQYFSELSDQKSAKDIVNEKSFTISQGNHNLSYNTNGSVPGIADLKKYLDDFQNNTMNTIKNDITNINNSLKKIASINNQSQSTTNNTENNNNNSSEQTQPNAPAANNGNAQPQQQATTASFKYNTSYGSLFMEDDNNSSSSEQKPANNNANANGSNNSQNSDNKKEKKSNYTVNFMKATTKVLSLKFNVANKTRFMAMKYCTQYVKNCGGNGVGNEKIDTTNLEIK